MSDAAGLKGFVVEALMDLGATVTEAGPLLWVDAPESVQRELEVPAAFALAFDPAHSGEFGAEFVAVGSYFFEKVLASATRRGRWDVARLRALDPQWWRSALEAVGLGTASSFRSELLSVEDNLLLIFSFRVTLIADEKRESYHRIAVSVEDGFAAPLEPEREDPVTVPADLPGFRPDLESAYPVAAEALRVRTQEELDRFRATSLSLLEEEVRRIFGFFDRSMEEIREADPQGSQDFLRAVMGERDRRLTESLERFDPKATATLCSIRAVFVPRVRLRLGFPNGAVAEAQLDALSQRIRGLRCGACSGSDGPWLWLENGLRCDRCAVTREGSAPLPTGPPSDIPRRGTRASGGAVRSSRGSKAQSRAASGGRRRT